MNGVTIQVALLLLRNTDNELSVPPLAEGGNLAAAGLAALCRGVLGEIVLIAFHELLDTLAGDVDLAADLFGLAGGQAADAKIGVDAGDHPLKQLLIRLPGEPITQRPSAETQPISPSAGDDRAQRPGIDVVASARRRGQ